MKLKQLIGICGVLLFAACDTDIEPVDQRFVTPETQDPALWAQYMTCLAEYKQSEHYMTYARFDNAPERISSEKDCLRSMPDSLDIVALVNPLSTFDREDLAGVQAKSIKVLLIADCSDPATAVQNVDDAIAAIAADGLDGIVVSYTGAVSDEAKATETTIAARLAALDKIAIFDGNADFVAVENRDKYSYYILDASNIGTVFSLRSEVDYTIERLGIPAEKLMLATSPSAVILDETLEEQTALLEVARCVMAYGPLAGLGVYDISDDYYSASENYPLAKSAINLLNPAYAE